MSYFRGQLVDAECAKTLLERVPTEAQFEAAGIRFNETGTEMSMSFLDWAKHVYQCKGKLRRGSEEDL